MPLRANIDIGLEIGRGEFGTVHRGEDISLNRPVAIKVVRRRIQELDEDWNKRKQDLLTEGQRLQDAEHDNIVRIHQVLEDEIEDAVLLVMEYCQGGCLNNQYLLGPMPLLMLRGIITDVCLGLEAIHARGMLHRDIKPSNIFLLQNGRAKIGDFGLVTDELIYGYAEAAGYINHLAPEIWDDYLTSIRTDIWAFGMTIYRLMHGEAFCSTLEPLNNEIDRLVRNGKFAAQLKWLPHVPMCWRKFVKKMLHDDATKRYQNSREVLQATARLAIEPSWTCSYSSDLIQWKRQKGNRIVEVSWLPSSSTGKSWTVESHPIGIGRSKVLAASEGVVSDKVALQDLESFFLKVT